MQTLVINTSAIKDPNLLKQISNEVGTSSYSPNRYKKLDGEYYCFRHGAREASTYKLEKWLEEADENGVGEIHITSIDSEGTKSKFPSEICKIASTTTKLPVILSGGIRSGETIIEIYETWGFTSFSFSSLTNIDGHTVKQLKSFLHSKNLLVRI